MNTNKNKYLDLLKKIYICKYNKRTLTVTQNNEVAVVNNHTFMQRTIYIKNTIRLSTCQVFHKKKIVHLVSFKTMALMTISI